MNLLPIYAYILFNESLQIIFECNSNVAIDLYKFSFSENFPISSGIYYKSANDLFDFFFKLNNNQNMPEDRLGSMTFNLDLLSLISTNANHPINILIILQQIHRDDSD